MLATTLKGMQIFEVLGFSVQQLDPPSRADNLDERSVASKNNR
jgi:hypothetical protein